MKCEWVSHDGDIISFRTIFQRSSTTTTVKVSNILHTCLVILGVNIRTMVGYYYHILLLVFLFHDAVSFLPNANNYVLQQRRPRWFDDDGAAAILTTVNNDNKDNNEEGGRRRTSSFALQAHSLNTAFEWLSDERSHQESYHGIEWIDIMDPQSSPLVQIQIRILSTITTITTIQTNT